MRMQKGHVFGSLRVCSVNRLLNVQVYFDYTNSVRVPAVTFLARLRISSDYLEDRNT